MGNKQAFSSNLNVTNVTGLNNPIIMAADEVIMKNIEKDKIDRINNSDNNNNGYTKSAIEVLSINRFTAESYASDIGHKDFSYKFGPKSNNDFKLLFVFFACNFFWTLIMTAIPVLVNLKPQNYYNPKGNLSPTQGTNDWYSSSDVMRLVEPLIGLPFQLILLLCTGMFEQWHNDNFAKALILTWALSAALYETGAGFHSASNMFKNALETYITDDEMKNYDDNLIPLYYYMRTVWEHNYAHYMYASGYAGMQICCCIAYSDKFQDTSSKFDIQTICFLFIAAIIYGLLLMAVAVDFPGGIAAMLGFTICHISAIGLYMFYLKHTQKDTLIFKFLRRPMLYFYLISYSIALILVLIWIAYAGCLCSRTQV